MDFNSKDELKENGFVGFMTVENLRIDKTCIPKKKGVYLILNENLDDEFIFPGVGGFFKDKDPNVSREELKRNFVKDSVVIYIGKAGSADGVATLNSRLGKFLDFGQGKKVGHWGGRLTWQLNCHKSLVVCWKLISHDDPKDIKKTFIKNFISQYGELPFANLQK